MKLTDNLDRILDKNSAAYLTLYSFRESLKRFFQLDEIPLVQSQDVKREMKKGVDDPNRAVATKYPYAYFSLSSIGLVKDQQGIKQIARNSLGMTLDDLANASIGKAYLFPAKIAVEFHYVTNDLVSAIDFSTKALIVTHSGKLNLRVELDGTSSIVGVTASSEEVSMPRSDKEAEGDPEGFDLAISFDIQCKLGVVKQVPKVNNRGTVTQSVDVRPKA
jgi:hypothetical protein